MGRLITLLLFFAVFSTSTVSAQDPTDFEQFIPYWTTEAGWRTELQLRNSLPAHDLTVTPSVRTSDGTETALPPVVIKSGDVASVDLNDVLAKAAPQLVGSWGSAALRYNAPVSRAVYAAAMIRDEGHPIDFHLDAAFQNADPLPGSREGIWWLKDSASDYLIVTNSAGRQLDAALHLYDPTGKSWQQSLTLAPRQSKRFSVRSLLLQSGLQGTYGGITVDTATGAGSLNTTYFLFDELVGFAALMKMFPRDPSSTVAERSWGRVQQWTTRAPMLALTNPDPALGFPVGTVLQPNVLVRNTTSQTYSVDMRF